jgi:hypothetical protein
MGDAAEKLTVSNVPRIQLNDGARIPQLGGCPAAPADGNHSFRQSWFC